MAKKMATVKYTEDYFGASLTYAQIAIESASRSKIVTTDVNSGDQLVLIGKNLGLDHGVPDQGVINKLVISDHDGTVLQVFSNLRLSADFVSGSTLPEFVSSLVTAAALKDTKYIGASSADSLTGFKGNDILLGLAGDDILSGRVGRDRMTGGAGNDTFIFSAGFGKDTITDFDADGGVGNQDLITAVFVDATITEDGPNTVLDFGNGDVLTLLNVSSADISVADFT